MDTSKSKTCKRCGEVRSIDQFSPVKGCKGGRRPVCTPCRSDVERQKRQENPAPYREKDKARYWENPERRASNRASAKAAYHRDIEAGRAYRREYHLRNPDVNDRARRKRRALLLAVEHLPYTRQEIYQRDGGTCQICRHALPNEPGAFHIDHIVPISLGGPDTPANVQLACPTCNREKWNRLEGQIHLPV